MNIYKKMLLVCQSFEMLISAGDNVLVESPTYSGALASVGTQIYFQLEVCAVFK